MLCGNTAYSVKLFGEDLSRYLDKIESVCLRKYPIHHYLTKKVMSQLQTFHTACTKSWQKTAGTDRHGMKTLRHYQPMYAGVTTIHAVRVIFFYIRH